MSGIDAEHVALAGAAQDDLAITFDPNWRALWERRFGDPLADAETFRLDADHHLLEIGGRASSMEEIEGQYMGLLRFGPRGWAEVKRIRAGLPGEVCDRMHMTGTLQRVIDERQILIKAFPYLGEWGEVDCEEDLAAYKS